MTTNNKALDDRCPRCGEAFFCGAAEPRCDCFDLNLTAAMRRSLAEQYSSCLCVACLKALQLEAEAALRVRHSPE